MRKIMTILLTIAIMFSLCSCSNTKKSKYTVGICQLVQHTALDAATKGVIDGLKAEFGEDIEIIEKNASGDASTCALICNEFVASQVDLIVANATPALLAAASSTGSIPILGTSISTYSAALNISNFTGATGLNISGTSDLAPLDKQAQIILDLVPTAKKVGILFCSSEANSVYQVEVVEKYLVERGIEVEKFSFSSSSDVALVTEDACNKCDALFVPTDNVAANCAELIGGIVNRYNIPVVCGEEGTCVTCGIATLTIDYYQLGLATAKMAVKVLKGEAKIAEMQIEYFDNPTYKFNKQMCEKLGIQVPDSFEEIK